MDKKKKNASGFALYGAVLVCLIAVGIGGWRLIHSGAANRAAQTRTAAVSGSALVPEQRQNNVPQTGSPSGAVNDESSSGAANTETSSSTADTSSQTAATSGNADKSTHTDTSAGTDTHKAVEPSDTTSGGDQSSSSGNTSTGGKTSTGSGGSASGTTSTGGKTSTSTGGKTTVSDTAENLSTAVPDTAHSSANTPNDTENTSTATSDSGKTVSTDSTDSISAAVPDSADTISTGTSDSGETVSTDSTESVSTASGADSSQSPDHTADTLETTRLVVPPLEGQTVTVFAMEELLYNDTLRDWRTHDGIDIAADYGAQVLAASAGTVVSVTDDVLMGTTVVIRHDGDWETVYSCLENAADIETGEDVSAGQVIGFVGQYTGAESSLGPHLHFGVFNGGTPVDPDTFLHPADNA